MFYPTEDQAKGSKIDCLDELKGSWDFILALVLIFSCVMSPYRLAFIEKDDIKWRVINLVVDLLFTTDIIVVFNTAIYDEDYKIMDDRKNIAINYFQGWFTIDVGAVIPFELIFGSIGTYNGLIKIARIGRLYKLLKLTKMMRVFKFLKENNAVIKSVLKSLNISKGLERILIYFCGFILVVHVLCCFWVLLA
jgi:hypothetical protein